jgi:DNA invertase Pin-like site-specific DNA recombinase
MTDSKSRNSRRNSAKRHIRDGFSNDAGVEVIPADESMTEMTNKTRVAAYCRVSTDDEAQAGSYELQVQYYTELIQDDPRMILVGVYADEGLSGTGVKKRKAFRQMIVDCEAGKIDLVITKNISRFARNTLDCVKYIRHLKSLDPPVGILFENEHINTTSQSSEIMITLLSCIAQSESERNSESVKWAFRSMFSHGIAIMKTWNLLGYDKNDNGEIIINEEEAETVRLIYRLYLEGMPGTAIANELMRRKIKTAKGNDIWRSAVVYSILKNEKYCGDIILQKTYTPDFLTHVSVKNEGQLPKYYIRNNHPAIIPREEWDRVQKKRRYITSHRKKRRGRTDRSIATTVIHGGILDGYVLIDSYWTAYMINRIIKEMEKDLL